MLRLKVPKSKTLLQGHISVIKTQTVFTELIIKTIQARKYMADAVLIMRQQEHTSATKGIFLHSKPQLKNQNISENYLKRYE